MTNDLWERKEVPPPLAKFEMDREFASENLEVLAGQESYRILNKQQYKNALKALRAIEKRIGPQGDELLSEREKLIREFTELKIRARDLAARRAVAADDEKRLIQDEAAILRDNVRSIRGDIEHLTQLLRPLRPWIIRRDRIRARLREHETAIQDAKLNEELTRKMAAEANYFSELIIRAWNQLGYCFDFTTPKGKHKRRAVKFESIVATPDSLQFKIYVTRMGLFAGSVNMLPPGVHVSKLIDEDTLYQLTSACERPVKCMNLADNPEKPDFSNGVWLEIDRTGVTDGLLERVAYKQVMARYDVDRRKLYPLPLGVRRGRHINWVNLINHPHVLIAGQTGSGKSNVINVIISLLISNYSPDEVRLVLIDLKEGVELRKYQAAPHVLGDVITDIEQTLEVMKQMEALRRERMLEIRQIASDIDSYNAIVPPDRQMPRVVIVFDEYGALQINKNLGAGVYDLTAQIAMKARAAGIHLVIGAQTPYNDIVPNKVKSNITLVLAGRQRTLGSSISTLGDKSATNLAKIPGRMICDDGQDSFQVQLPYISNEEVQAAIQTAQNYAPGRAIALTELANVEMELEDVLEVKPFTEEDFIRICIEDLNGVISFRKVYDIIGGRVSQPELERMGDEIKAKTEVTYQGEIYVFTPYGKGKKLQKREKEKTNVYKEDVFDSFSPSFTETEEKIAV